MLRPQRAGCIGGLLYNIKQGKPFFLKRRRKATLAEEKSYKGTPRCCIRPWFLLEPVGEDTGTSRGACQEPNSNRCCIRSSFLLELTCVDARMGQEKSCETSTTMIPWFPRATTAPTDAEWKHASSGMARCWDPPAKRLQAVIRVATLVVTASCAFLLEPTGHRRSPFAGTGSRICWNQRL